jgi:hypothetical protein
VCRDCEEKAVTAAHFGLGEVDERKAWKAIDEA